MAPHLLQEYRQYILHIMLSDLCFMPLNSPGIFTSVHLEIKEFQNVQLRDTLEMYCFLPLQVTFSYKFNFEWLNRSH